MTPPSGAVDATVVVFEACLDQVLLPRLSLGRIVVMDNLSTHKSERVRALIDAAGCEVLYLPPSGAPLDFNSIEGTFAKIKVVLRKTEARTSKALMEAMETAISSIPAREVRAFFGHCGYRVVRHPF